MVSKKLRILMAAAMIYSMNTAFGLGEEQREILETLHAMQQPLETVPFIAQQKPMFIGITEMEIQSIERALAAIREDLSSALLHGAAWFMGHTAGKALLENILFTASYDIKKYSTIISHVFFGLVALGNVYIGMNFYDTLKEKSRLNKRLELYQAILEKLQELPEVELPASEQLAELPSHKE